jgi:hypothetical protein
MPFDRGLRLNNRQRIANARKKPIEANKNQSVDGAEGLFLRSGSPQNVYLLPQRQNFRLERCPRPKQIYDRPNNEPDKISHPATASPDSRSTASQTEFATGTGAIASSISPPTDSLMRPQPDHKMFKATAAASAGSRMDQPEIAAIPTPPSTPIEESTSVKRCRPSATRAGDLSCRPRRIKSQDHPALMKKQSGQWKNGAHPGLVASADQKPWATQR